MGNSLYSITVRYITVQYTTSTVSLTMCGLVGYLVMFHSPNKMGNYKYFVLNSTMGDVIYELFCYILFQPVPLFPAYSGVCLGWLNRLGRRFCYYGFVSYILVFGYMLWSLTVSFFYRYRVIASVRIKKYLDHKLVMPFLFVFGFIGIGVPMSALAYSEEIDYAIVRNNTILVWPNYASEVDNFVLFGAKDGTAAYVFIALISVLLFVNSIVAITLATLIHKELKKQAHVMSQQTQIMHKTLSNILLAQILLPVGFVLIPVLICISFIVFHYANKDLIWVSLTPLTLYPLISNSIFLYFSKSHRQAFVRLIKTHVLRRKEVTSIAVISNSNNSMLYRHSTN